MLGCPCSARSEEDPDGGLRTCQTPLPFWTRTPHRSLQPLRADVPELSVPVAAGAGLLYKLEGAAAPLSSSPPPRRKASPGAPRPGGPAGCGRRLRPSDSGSRGARRRRARGVGASSLRAGALLRTRPAPLAPRLGSRRRPRPPAHSAELRGNGCGTPEACDPR